jgi:hypothetical protein
MDVPGGPIASSLSRSSRVPAAALAAAESSQALQGFGQQRFAFGFGASFQQVGQWALTRLVGRRLGGMGVVLAGRQAAVPTDP